MSPSLLEEHRPRILQIAFVVFIASLVYSILFANLVAFFSLAADIIVIAVTLWLLYRIAVGVERIARASERIATVRERGLRNDVDREDL